MFLFSGEVWYCVMFYILVRVAITSATRIYPKDFVHFGLFDILAIFHILVSVAITSATRIFPNEGSKEVVFVRSVARATLKQERPL